MKTSFSFGLILLVGFLLWMTSCDKVDAPYRTTTSVGVVYINNDTVVIDGDTLGFNSDNTNPGKKVLAEDYTGILCGNCPYAGIKLNDTIQPAYGDRLVVVSVHAGFFAEPCPGGLACPGSQPAGAFQTDFRTTTGEEWDHNFGNSNAGNPNGLIDRVGFPTSQHIKSPSSWATVIQQRSNVPAPFAIRVQKVYDAASRELKIAVQARAVSDLSGDYKLTVILTEDSLTDWQEWYPPVTPEYDPNYIHRHVLRTSVNSDYGETIASGTITGGTLALRGFKYTLNPAWVSNHMRIVAFVSDETTYEVKQVEALWVQ
ncbi:MAG: Omp28-related outer membrane protein [Bacteroidetes bacterium]|nr:Omp28-related outer membrane protein [Bacteroidota bacterium]MBK9523584.1 Omp28-related outer membrane protein [Bacteroidota bacterium]MBK9541332.1 Omp28-related outer membrane protein [Bacteroidota bacterium]MBP6401922.1 Omp28-related outer membrane protein [Bacteroidia bacterium]MBP6648587.1 Omp28-related outer membrane protein [Bacteroidia bacterium]